MLSVKFWGNMDWIRFYKYFIILKHNMRSKGVETDN